MSVRVGAPGCSWVRVHVYLEVSLFLLQHLLEDLTGVFLHLCMLHHVHKTRKSKVNTKQPTMDNNLTK